MPRAHVVGMVSAGAGAPAGVGAPALAQPVQYRTLALSGQAAPGVAGATFESLSDPRISITGGAVAFRANLAGTGVTTDNDGSIWSDRSGALALVYREGTPVAGTTA